MTTDEDVPGGEVPVDVVHLGEVLHLVGHAAQHPYQLHHLELSPVDAEEGVQGAVLHILGDEHDRSGLGHHTLDEDQGLCEKVSPDFSPEPGFIVLMATNMSCLSC